MRLEAREGSPVVPLAARLQCRGSLLGCEFMDQSGGRVLVALWLWGGLPTATLLSTEGLHRAVYWRPAVRRVVGSGDPPTTVAAVSWFAPRTNYCVPLALPVHAAATTLAEPVAHKM